MSTGGEVRLGLAAVELGQTNAFSYRPPPFGTVVIMLVYTAYINISVYMFTQVMGVNHDKTTASNAGWLA